MKKIYMETTKMPVEKTVADIQMILGRYGACGVMTQFKDGEVEAVFFKVLFLGKEVPFRLPCRWEPIEKEFRSRVKKWPISTNENVLVKEKEIRDQAKRVAWRQILRWVEAQMALVETDMVKVQEVFLPYIQTNIEGQTLFDKIENNGLKLLEAK